MKHLIMYFFFTLFLFSCFPAIAQDTIRQQVSDTTQSEAGTVSNTHHEQDGEFDIFLLLFGMAAISFMAGFIFIGVIAAVAIVMALMGMAAAGVFSFSILTGWYQKSISKGVKVFFVTGGMAVGIITGILGFGLVSLLFNLHLQKQTIGITGTVSGIIAGGILGLIIFKILKAAILFAKNKFKE